MQLAYDGTGDSDARLATILERRWALHRFTVGRDAVPAKAAGVLVFDHSLAAEAAGALHEECSRRRVPWLAVVDRGRHVQVGPLYAEWLAPLCPHCASQRLLSAPPDGVSLDKALLQRRVSAEILATAAPPYPQPLLHLIAATVMAQLSEPDAHAGRVVLLDSVGAAVSRAALSGLHGCPRCRRDATVLQPPFVHHLEPASPAGAVA